MKKILLVCIPDLRLKMKKDYVKLGKFLLFNYKYFQKLFPHVRPNDNIDYAGSLIPNSKSKTDFLFYETNENVLTKKFEKNFASLLNEFVDIVLYMTGKRCYAKADYYIFNERSDKSLYILPNWVDFISRSDSHILYENKCSISEYLFKKVGNDRELFNFVGESPNTELEKKIKLAIYWIALGLRTSELTQAYICLCIALESLLSGKNGPLERGTAYQLREFGAFLVSADKEGRLKVQDTIKNLYDIRCKISHSGICRDLTEKDFYLLLSILKAIIGKLFYIVRNNNIKNHDDLKKYIDELKFQ